MADERSTDIQSLVQGLTILEKYDKDMSVYAYGDETIHACWGKDVSDEDRARLVALGWTEPTDDYGHTLWAWDR